MNIETKKKELAMTFREATETLFIRYEKDQATIKSLGMGPKATEIVLKNLSKLYEVKLTKICADMGLTIPSIKE